MQTHAAAWPAFSKESVFEGAAPNFAVFKNMGRKRLIIHDGNRDYYRMRAKEELRRADKAVGSARKTHMQQAAKYEKMATAAREIVLD